MGRYVLVGFVLLIGASGRALETGDPAAISTLWIVIGVVILYGHRIMISVANSGTKENIQIDRK
jgi:hypothetical protein